MASESQNNEQAQPSGWSQFATLGSGLVAIATGSTLLKTVDLAKRPFSKAAGIAGIAIGALSTVCSLLSWRSASKAQNQTAPIDREQADTPNTIANEAANGGHVTRLQQEQTSEISR